MFQPKHTAADRLEEVEAAYTDALATYKQLAADFPTRPVFRQELARSQNNLGTLFRDTGRMSEAKAAYDRAFAIQQQLAADYPTRPDFRKELAGSLNNLSILFKDTARLKEAEAACQAALAIQKQLSADFPKVPDYQNDLAETLGNLAELANDRHDFSHARRLLNGAEAHHRAALEANAKEPDYRQVYRDNLMVLTRSCAGQADQASAVLTAHKLRNLGWDAARDGYDAACALALCVPVVEKEDKAIKDERKKRMQFYADQAMAMLRDAVAKGYKDVAHMKTDTDLDPLRQREDFKALIAELEQKAKTKPK